MAPVIDRILDFIALLKQSWQTLIKAFDLMSDEIGFQRGESISESKVIIQHAIHEALGVFQKLGTRQVGDINPFYPVG